MTIKCDESGGHYGGKCDNKMKCKFCQSDKHKNWKSWECAYWRIYAILTSLFNDYYKKNKKINGIFIGRLENNQIRKYIFLFVLYLKPKISLVSFFEFFVLFCFVLFCLFSVFVLFFLRVAPYILFYSFSISSCQAHAYAKLFWVFCFCFCFLFLFLFNMILGNRYME